MMKTSTTLILASLLLSAVTASAQTTQATPAGQAAHAAPVYKANTPKLNKAQIDQLLAAPEQLVIIDLRRPDELSKIGGFAVYLSIQAKDLAQSLAFIPQDRKIVTVSNHAGRAGKGADFLASKGYNVVGAIGAQDYEAQGGTLARITPPAKKATDKTTANATGKSAE
jgi:rhodanese-related sulfurtransferase